MEINMIAAVGKNRELGKDNKLIWHLPGDLKFFKEMTMGKTVVMGRKTFESLPKILPGRKNVVLSRSKQNYPEEVLVYKSLKQLLLELKEDEIFVIGGEQIYTLFLEYATKLYLTEVEAEDKEADAYFPEFDKNDWNRNELATHQGEITYTHVEYVKKRGV